MATDQRAHQWNRANEVCVEDRAKDPRLSQIGGKRSDEAICSCDRSRERRRTHAHRPREGHPSLPVHDLNQSGESEEYEVRRPSEESGLYNKEWNTEKEDEAVSGDKGGAYAAPPALRGFPIRLKNVEGIERTEPGAYKEQINKMGASCSDPEQGR